MNTCEPTLLSKQCMQQLHIVFPTDLSITIIVGKLEGQNLGKWAKGCYDECNFGSLALVAYIHFSMPKFGEQTSFHQILLPPIIYGMTWFFHSIYLNSLPVQSWRWHCSTNSTYGADASVLVQMSTESAQTTCMHCYKFQTPADTMSW